MQSQNRMVLNVSVSKKMFLLRFTVLLTVFYSTDNSVSNAEARFDPVCFLSALLISHYAQN